MKVELDGRAEYATSEERTPKSLEISDKGQLKIIQKLFWRTHGTANSGYEEVVKAGSDLLLYFIL